MFAKILRACLGCQLIITLFFQLSCSEDNPTESNLTLPEITDLTVPAVIYADGSEKLVTVIVRDPQGLANIQSVNYVVQKSASGQEAASGLLLDDGNRGDVISKDGLFSSLIDGSFAPNDSGGFNIQVMALDKDGNQSNTLEDSFVLRLGPENFAPEILSFSAPSSVAFDSTFSFVITATVSDPEGLLDVESVGYRFFPPAHPNPSVEGVFSDDGTGEDLLAGDGTFTTALSSDLVEVAADYFVRVQAEDQAGNRSNAAVAVIRGRSRIDSSPVIGEIDAPVIVNVNRTTEVLIRAPVTDPDGLADIDTVTFRVFLPDGQEDAGSPHHMHDDGDPVNSGDLVEGDGIYSAILAVANAGAEPIDLRLLFLAKDLSGFLSPTIEHILTVALDDAPVISNLNAPSQVQADPIQDKLIFMAIDVKDPQGVSDIETVWFRSFLPSGEEAQNSPTLLFDDGMRDENGDEDAGDGTYSIVIRLPAGTPPGSFRFDFEAFDRTGLSSNKIEHLLTISN